MANIQLREVLKASDQVLDGTDLQEEIDNLMEQHFEDIADAIANLRGLSDEEREQLLERLAWQVVLVD